MTTPDEPQQAEPEPMDGRFVRRGDRTTELAMMRTVGDKLDSLSGPGRRRVLHWLNAHFDFDPMDPF